MSAGLCEPPKFINQVPCSASVHRDRPGSLRRLLSAITREADLFWKTRIVEGIFLRRQIRRVYSILGGHIFFQTLSSAVELGLFDTLRARPGLNAEELATQIGIEAQPMRILLLGCTSLGLVRNKSGRYCNARIAERLFVTNSPRSIVPVVKWQNEINYRAMGHFAESLRANSNVGLQEFPGHEPTLYARLSHDPHLERVFQDAMQSISVQANQLLAKYCDLSDVSKVVDIGGGNGTNVMKLVERWPHLRAEVFDLSGICAIAESMFAGHTHSGRLSTQAGNCFADEFPSDADCFIFCHFLTIWSKEENTSLLKKAHRALPIRGKVVIFNMMQSDRRNGPMSAAMGSPYFLTLATGRGMLYCWDEYKEMLRCAGFSQVHCQRLPHDHGQIIATK